MSRVSVGRQGEQFAQRFLEQQGMHLVQANFRSPVGEIDLIMQTADSLIFVEVKYRSNEDFASVLEQISELQCQRIRRAAEYFLMSKNIDENKTTIRFDVVAIVDEQHHWLQDAF